MGAEPRPASLEKTPRPTPLVIASLMDMPAAPPVTAAGVKSSLKDGGKHAGNGADIRKHDDKRADDVNDGHAGHELFRDLTDALDAAEQHQRDEDGDTDAGDQADEHLLIRRVLVERDGDGLDGVRDGVHLCDVADAERRDGAEDGEHTAEPLPPLGPRPLFDVVHGSAAPVAHFRCARGI